MMGVENRYLGFGGKLCHSIRECGVHGSTQSGESVAGQLAPTRKRLTMDSSSPVLPSPFYPIYFQETSFIFF